MNWPFGHKNAELNAQIVNLAPIHVLMVRHTGSYDGISPVFDQLWSWIESHGIQTKRTIGVYWDDPDTTPTARLRSAACFEIADGTAIPPDTGGMAIEATYIQGGQYVTTTFTGPYEKLAPVWSNLTSYTQNTLGKQISDNPAFEIYVNDASETPADQLITELYMPVV